jgi:hypothetical protein
MKKIPIPELVNMLESMKRGTYQEAVLLMDQADPVAVLLSYEKYLELVRGYELNNNK